jgi:hypothetical protein
VTLFVETLETRKPSLVRVFFHTSSLCQSVPSVTARVVGPVPAVVDVSRRTSRPSSYHSNFGLTVTWEPRPMLLVMTSRGVRFGS